MKSIPLLDKQPHAPAPPAAAACCNVEKKRGGYNPGDPIPDPTSISHGDGDPTAKRNFKSSERVKIKSGHRKPKKQTEFRRGRRSIPLSTSDFIPFTSELGHAS